MSPRPGQGHPDLVSPDRHSALVQFDVKGKAEDADTKIAPILAAIAGAQTGFPSVIIEEFGEASANHELDRRFEGDMSRAEFTSLPLGSAALGTLIADEIAKWAKVVKAAGLKAE